MQDQETELKTLIKKHLIKNISFVQIPEEIWHPLTDVYITSGEIIVIMELAGVEAKDISVILEGRRLLIKGTRKDKSKCRKISYQQMEINYGPFRKTINLPADINSRKMKASYKNGFLEVCLPLGVEAQSDLATINIE